MARSPAPAAKQSDSTEVATMPQGGALAIPDDMVHDFADAAGMGAEGINKEDTLVPFLRIIQALSPQRTRGKPEYIPGIEEGDILETASGSFVKSDQGVFVVPISYIRRHTEWWPRDSKEGKGLVKDYGADASCLENTEKNDRGQNMTNRGTIINVTGDYFCFLVDKDQGTWSPVVISMGGTQQRKARQWNTRLTSLRVPVQGKLVQPPLFYMLWHLTTVPESNDNGAWFGWKIESVGPIFGFPFGKDLFQSALSFAKQVQAGEVKAAPVDDGEHAASAGPATGDDHVPF